MWVHRYSLYNYALQYVFGINTYCISYQSIIKDDYPKIYKSKIDLDFKVEMVRWIEYNTCILSATMERQKCEETEYRDTSPKISSVSGGARGDFAFVFCFSFF